MTAAAALMGRGLAQRQMIVLIGCVSVIVTGDGGPKFRKFCGRHKWKPPIGTNHKCRHAREGGGCPKHDVVREVAWI